MKYFIKTIDFPNLQGDILKFNVLYDFVSSSWLNAFINNCELLQVIAIDRYEPIDSKKLKAMIDLDNGITTSNLSFLKDDIIVLGHINKDEYIFFYFDYDISDCKIGRFQTSDSIEEIKSNVINYIANRLKPGEIKEYIDDGIKDYSILPIKAFKGWLKY